MSDLSRFHSAQADVCPTALAEIRAGAKRTHWMWFIFPQLRALGRSPTAKHYGIADIAEARAYLDDPVLGPRLRECCAALLKHHAAPESILGPVDALKLRSCATLFMHVSDEPVFRKILAQFYNGEPCPLTEDLLRTN